MVMHMISFVWHGVQFSASEIGGGVLHGEIEMHEHSKNSYELHYIVSGRGRLLTDTSEYPLSAGNFFVTGPQVPHAQYSDPCAPMEDIFIYIQKNGMVQKDAVGDTFCETHFWFCNRFPSDTMQMILEEYRFKRADYETAAAGLLMKLLTDIVRWYLPQDYARTASFANLNDRRFWLIENAFLDEKNITLRALSQKIGLCERQTERLLKKYYGKSFREMKQKIVDL